MINVEIIEVLDAVTGQIQEHAIINRGNGEYTSMTKAQYEKEQLQPTVEVTQ